MSVRVISGFSFEPVAEIDPEILPRSAPRTLRGVSRPALKSYSYVSLAVGMTDVVALTALLYCFVTVAAGSPIDLILDAPACLACTGFGLVAALWAASHRGLYNVVRMVRPREAASRAAFPLILSVLSASVALSIAGLPKSAVATGAFASLVAGGGFLVLSRIAWGRVVTYGVHSGRLRYRVAVFGGHNGQIVRRLAGLHSPFVEAIASYDTAEGRAGDPHEAIGALLARAREERVDAIILGYPLEDSERLRIIFRALRATVAEIFVSGDLPVRGSLQPGHPLALLPLLPVQRSAMTDLDMALKGIFDRLAGLALLAILSPLLILVAVAIKLDSPGPILFRQPRIGYNNAPFTMFKFRSMQNHLADVEAWSQTVQGDPRVTRAGRLIRRFSIDELPQLLNVVAGAMSLVGPRPHAPGTNVDGFLLERIASGYPMRHRVLPGITGWAQINGSRGALSSPEAIARRVRLDLHYIENWSIGLDMKILALTALREIVSRRAH